jgi:hypothetical protein
MSNTTPGALDAVKERWRLDKTVSGQTVIIALVSFVGASLMNLAAIVWFAGRVVADVEKNSEDIAALQSAQFLERNEKMANASRMAVLENRAVTTEAAVLRVEADVKKLLERRRETP